MMAHIALISHTIFIKVFVRASPLEHSSSVSHSPPSSSSSSSSKPVPLSTTTTTTTSSSLPLTTNRLAWRIASIVTVVGIYKSLQWWQLHRHRRQLPDSDSEEDDVDQTERNSSIHSSSNSGRNAGTSNFVPPPPPFVVIPTPAYGDKGGLGDGVDQRLGRVLLPLDQTLCPLCNEPRVHPTASSSGCVFCYKCIFEYVDQHKRCPVTSLPCIVSQIRRIFDD
jgi:hypothetical protein